MSIRKLVRTFCCLSIVWGHADVAVHAAEFGQGSIRPNIVVIMADDLGWKDVHCYGNERLNTPALDQLAEEGMRFTDAYAASPVCSPTRAAMMTGQSPARLGLTNHAPGHPNGFAPEGSEVVEADWIRHLPLRHVTIAERLADAGYATAHIGKWHLSHVDKSNQVNLSEVSLRPEFQGFDVNIGGCSRGGPPSYFAPYRIPALKDGEVGEYLPRRLADEAIEFINNPHEGPFFLSWWPYSVHYPHQAPEELIDKYRQAKGSGLRNPIYAAMIEGMDIEIGRFLKALDDAGLRENTLVVFKSDNGGYDGDNRPLRGLKGMLYEGGLRIPWIVRWPGRVQENTTCDTPIISTDCYPTLLEVAGLKATPNHPLDGRSLLPILTQSGELDRDALYFHYPNYAFHKKNKPGGVIREGQYKLISRYCGSGQELYHLGTDIGETNNLSDEMPDLARRLEQKLNTWLKQTGANMPRRRSAQTP